MAWDNQYQRLYSGCICITHLFGRFLLSLSLSLLLTFLATAPVLMPVTFHRLEDGLLSQTDIARSSKSSHTYKGKASTNLYNWFGVLFNQFKFYL